MRGSQIADKEESMRKTRISQKENLPPNAKLVVSLDTTL